ncbi:MAG TPA: hypothetical protein VHM90_11135 [Phycisphaerae bacterium]|nr:hypothetical protein [Phycisphaerae bacterium]
MPDTRDIQSLAERFDSRERAARRRSILLTLVPAALGLALLAGTLVVTRTEVQRASEASLLAAQKADELKGTAAVLSETRAKLTDAEKQLADAQKRLADATNLVRAAHPFNPDDLKAAMVRNPPGVGDILMRIVNLRATPWNLTGQTPAEGFNSDRFARYIIQQNGNGTLDNATPVDAPAPGDVALYPGGSTLFYFLDAQGRPFVIGMTPLGILSLDPDFAKPASYRRLKNNP